MQYQTPVRNWSKLGREKQAKWLTKAREVVYPLGNEPVTGAKELRVYQLAERLYYTHARSKEHA